MADRARPSEAALFVDGRYTLQAAQAGRSTAWHDRAAGRSAAGKLARAEPDGRRPPRLRSVAAHFRGSRAAGRGLRQGRRGAGRGRQQSARCGLDRAPCRRRSARSRCTTLQFAGETEADKLDAHPRRDRASSAPMRWCCRIRTRWPGPSTSAAPTSRIRRCRSSYALVPKDGRPTLFIDSRKLSNSARDHLEASRRGRASRTRLTPNSTALGAGAAQRSRSTARPPPTR